MCDGVYKMHKMRACCYTPHHTHTHTCHAHTTDKVGWCWMGVGCSLLLCVCMNQRVSNPGCPIDKLLSPTHTPTWYAHAGGAVTAIPSPAVSCDGRRYVDDHHYHRHNHHHTIPDQSPQPTRSDAEELESRLVISPNAALFFL